MKHGSFSYHYYSNLLGVFASNGYSFNFFTDTECKRSVFLRHDVDIDIFSCETLSVVEKDAGAKSTWFFQPNNDLYNMLSDRSVQIINTCYANGGQIGLHIDGKQFRNTEEAIVRIKEMFDFYSCFIPLSPVFSFHRPIGNDFNISICGYVNAYDPRFFSDITYVSDSNRREFWKEQGLAEAIAENRSVCLLTHPLWWKNEELSDNRIIEYVEESVVQQLALPALKKNIKRFAKIDAELEC